jgi:hypothetical protein
MFLQAQQRNSPFNLSQRYQLQENIRVLAVIRRCVILFVVAVAIGVVLMGIAFNSLSGAEDKVRGVFWWALEEREGMIKSVFYFFVKNLIAYIHYSNVSSRALHKNKAQTLSYLTS